jgi:hypothetical protein
MPVRPLPLPVRCFMRPTRLVAPLTLLLVMASSAQGASAFEQAESSPTVHSDLVSPPSDSARPVVARLLGVSCVGTAGCWAVGAYQRHGEHTAPMVIELVDGRGVDPRVIALPPSADPSGYASLASVSCKTMGQCVAVGTYTSPASGSRSGSELPMVAISAAGRWQRAIAVVLPNDAASGAAATGDLAAVTCTATVDCVAVGSFMDRGGQGRAFRVAISPRAPHGAVSRGVELPFAPLTKVLGEGLEGMSLSDVSCWAPSDCIAVGAVSAHHGNRSVAVTEETHDARWMPEVEASLPPAASPVDSSSWLDAVSCPTPGSCIAVGTVQPNGSGSSSGLVATRVRSGWRAGTLLTGSSGHSVQLQSVACVTGHSECAATGYASSYNNLTLTESTTAVLSVGTVASLPDLLDVKLPRPSGGAPNVKELLSIDCPRVASCTAVGLVTDVGGHVIAYSHPAVAIITPHGA